MLVGTLITALRAEGIAQIKRYSMLVWVLHRVQCPLTVLALSTVVSRRSPSPMPVEFVVLRRRLVHHAAANLCCFTLISVTGFVASDSTGKSFCG